MLFVRSQVFRHMTMCCSVAVSGRLKQHSFYNLRARMSKKTGLVDPRKGKKLCFSEYWKPVTQKHNVKSQKTWKTQYLIFWKVFFIYKGFICYSFKC